MTNHSHFNGRSAVGQPPKRSHSVNLYTLDLVGSDRRVRIAE